jgi:hypothetical protein
VERASLLRLTPLFQKTILLLFARAGLNLSVSLFLFNNRVLRVISNNTVV